MIASISEGVRYSRDRYDALGGGREWESNPPRTGKRPFPGFEVRTPHRGRFSSIWNDRTRLMAWTADNEGAKISFWTQTGPEAARMAFYSTPLTIAAMTPPRSRHHPHMGSRQDRQGARHRPAQGRLLGSIARNDPVEL